MFLHQELQADTVAFRQPAERKGEKPFQEARHQQRYEPLPRLDGKDSTIVSRL